MNKQTCRIKYISCANELQLEKAADLLDEGKDEITPLPIDRARFKRARKHFLAIDENIHKVVGVGVLKDDQDDAVEIGYLRVEPLYRGQGIGSELMLLQIIEARRLKLQLIYANVKHDNKNSLAIIKKMGFQHWGYYTSGDSNGNTFYWLSFYLTLAPDLNVKAIMSKKNTNLTPLKSIPEI
jgi:N-acetylglutamate synthase-like GNAT family acetyltransferase